MPDMQPVTTETPGASWWSAQVMARTQPGPAARDPETPTTDAERRTRETTRTEGSGEAGMA